MADTGRPGGCEAGGSGGGGHMSSYSGLERCDSSSCKGGRPLPR